MNVLILGAGGIGAYFGSRLIPAGHTVHFVVHGEHGATLSTAGLRLEHPHHRYQGPVIRRCEQQGLDAPYTRSIATLLGWGLR